MVISKKRKIGDLGEKLVEKHLVKHNFKILNRNYQKKWGEIDIIAQKNDIIHFIEVKTKIQRSDRWKNYDPLENIQNWKIKKIMRGMQGYLTEQKLPQNTKWQIDMAAVLFDFENKKAKIKLIQDI